MKLIGGSNIALTAYQDRLLDVVIRRGEGSSLLLPPLLFPPLASITAATMSASSSSSTIRSGVALELLVEFRRTWQLKPEQRAQIDEVLAKLRAPEPEDTAGESSAGMAAREQGSRGRSERKPQSGLESGGDDSGEEEAANNGTIGSSKDKGPEHHRPPHRVIAEKGLVVTWPR